MFTRAFFKFFPPPDFLRMPAVGLDVSDEAIRFVEFVEGSKGLELGRYGERLLPRGIVDSGYINDPTTVVRLLKELKKEFDLNFIRAALPEEKAYLFRIEIPSVSHKEIRAAIELRLEENVPIKPAEAIFDYEIGKENTEERTMEVNVSVLPEKVIKTYLDVFNQAGLTPLDFEMEGRAIERAFIRDGDNGTYMIVNFAERKTGVFIVSDGTVRFTSTLAIGGEALTNTLAKTLSISLEDAQKLKYDRGSVNKDSADVFDYSMNTLSALKDEINKVCVYWATHEDANKKIEKVILSGENSGLVGFGKYLALCLKISVEQGNPWINAFTFDDYIPALEASRALSYGVPVGLALPLFKHHV